MTGCAAVVRSRSIPRQSLQTQRQIHGHPEYNTKVQYREKCTTHWQSGIAIIAPCFPFQHAGRNRTLRKLFFVEGEKVSSERKCVISEADPDRRPQANKRNVAVNERMQALRLTPRLVMPRAVRSMSGKHGHVSTKIMHSFTSGGIIRFVECRSI